MLLNLKTAQKHNSNSDLTLGHLSLDCLEQSLLSPSTLKSYSAHWSRFQNWCAKNRISVLPVNPHYVSEYLTNNKPNLSLSAKRVIISAISHFQKLKGFSGLRFSQINNYLYLDIDSLTTDSARFTPPLTKKQLERIFSLWPENTASRRHVLDVRDKAIMLLCFFAGLQRSELVNIDRDDIAVNINFIQIAIKAKRSSDSVDFVTINRLPEGDLCPATALLNWLHISVNHTGPLFCQIKPDNTFGQRLQGNGVWKIIKRRCALIQTHNEEGRSICPHSFRAGFIAMSYSMGYADDEVARMARIKNKSSLRSFRCLS